MEISNEFVYVALIFVLFIAPKMLERFYLPAGLTAFFIGMSCALGFGLFKESPTINVLSILGISALFLFAGFEVNIRDLKKNAPALLQHMFIQTILMTVVTYGIYSTLDMPFRACCLYALALVTPSTGFIIDSMGSIKLKEEQQFAIKTNAIATEILALFLMFITLQSASPLKLAGSSLGLVLLIAAVPLVFKFFVKIIAPHAPDSEFAFFMMLAVIAGLITYKLGAYYLVGAFVVGISIQRFRILFPEMDTSSMIHSLRVFSAFFIPFYFFKAGTKVSVEALSPYALLLGLLLIAIIAPTRIFLVEVHRRFTTKENYSERLNVALCMSPTLVFGLVLAGLLKTEYDIKPIYFGGLIVYTVLITFLPGLIMKKRQEANRDIAPKPSLI